eukprot:GHVO01019383.1.p1 GENE.GHVO01019383.1~~GHVO01019383.1.p1  ORF type:complete len:108 (+),score=5.59 GHVO01019383.1:579-902(+)
MFADAPVNDEEDGLATLAEDEIIDFEDEFDLTDDNAWVSVLLKCLLHSAKVHPFLQTSVPSNHVYSRFIQYRKLVRHCFGFYHLDIFRFYSSVSVAWTNWNSSSTWL